ncbi:hypothetical protein F4805DRAFT_457278 [Annulohypoxylon moriforme]|nr:hypothetical protein F4805DRAFT_457278 [Annulohypoxylon moriforme]
MGLAVTSEGGLREVFHLHRLSAVRRTWEKVYGVNRHCLPSDFRHDRGRNRLDNVEQDARSLQKLFNVVQDMPKAPRSIPQDESQQYRLCCQLRHLFKRKALISRLLALAAPSSSMPTKRRVRDILDATRDHISIMSGRYCISPVDFDQLYELYQEDTSAKGLYEFIVDHHITHSIAGRLNIRPIDVLATMVGKSADTCQEELEAEKKLYQVAAERAAAKTKVERSEDSNGPKEEGKSQDDGNNNLSK